MELALCLPLLLVVIAGIVDFAFLFQRYEVITNAAREGARLAALPGYTDEVVQAHVREYVKKGLAMDDLSAVMPVGGGGGDESVVVTPITISVDVGGTTATIPANRVTVTYKHSFLLMGPMLAMINGSWGDTMDLVAVSQMRPEVPAGGA